MPDTDAPSRSDSSSASAAPMERVNLPALVPQAAPAERELGETWLSRVLRAVFGWKTSARADLQTVLEGSARTAKAASRRKSAPCSPTSWRCAGAGWTT